jgi:hypothetical protein
LELAALREGLGRANPGFTDHELDEAVRAILRQHEDPEEHDRSLIAERLRWSPDERLRALQSFLEGPRSPAHATAAQSHAAGEDRPA